MIMTRWQWILRQMSRRLFLRAGVISALSVASAVLAILLKDYIPENLVLTLGADAVGSILTIIASSMLAVTTFSLSTVVQAFATAATTATPRATALLQDDTAVQNMLSTFVGAFIFSLAGLILLKTGIYGESGRVVLFLVTILVVVLLVMTLLRWIDFLLSFGRLDEEIEAVEAAGIAWSIVPGITAASAAVASAGQSLTRRGRNSELRLLTGHDVKGFADHDWAALARPGAVAAIYMAKRGARFLQGRLLMHGALPQTPVTVVENASRPDEQILGAHLGTLSDDIARAGLSGPAVLLYGLAPRSAAAALDTLSQKEFAL